MAIVGCGGKQVVCVRMAGGNVRRHPAQAYGAYQSIVERNGLETGAADNLIAFFVPHDFIAGKAGARKEDIKDDVFQAAYHIY